MSPPRKKPTSNEVGGTAKFSLEDMVFPSDGRWNGLQAFASRGPGGRPMVTVRIYRGRGKEPLDFDLTESEVGELEAALKRWLEEK